MLDIKLIRENKEIVKEGARKKHITIDIDELIAIDESRRALMISIEAKRTKQNEISEKISRTNIDNERIAMINDMKPLKAELAAEEEKLKEVVKKWRDLMLRVPNIPDMSVPEGESDAENQEVRTWGDPHVQNVPAFPVKNYMELTESLGLVDLERGSKVSGFRGYFLKGQGARLSFALWNMVMDMMTKRGFTPFIAPSLVRPESFMGTGYLPQSEEDLYKTQDGDFLTGTAEVPMMGYLSEEIIDAQRFPLKMLGFSPCFRREAGAHGKDAKGIYRVHEFYKVEQIVLCKADHAESVRLHEELTANAEDILKALEIPYRVVVNCGGDLGLGQVKKYDIEAWVPSEKRYRETHSSSYFHDFQTRRLNIRYKDEQGKMKFAHSLNNTAIATPRVLISLLENHQQADGTIKLPAALVPYMGTDTIRP